MKTLITGHKGFCGKHLTKELDKRNIPWVGYDILDGQDIRNKFQLDQVFEKEQVSNIIHLAARPGVRQGKNYPEEFISTNILGTQNVVDLCNKYNIDKIIFYSSSSVYGGLSSNPITESNSRPNPVSLYGITKLAGEYIIGNAECQTVIIRPFTIYGPSIDETSRRKDEVVYKWLEQYKVGKPITVYDLDSFRGYVYVEDLIKATVDLMEKGWDCKHENINLGGSEVIHLKDIVEIFKKNFKDLKIDKQERPKEDVHGQYTSIDRAKLLLKFNPEPKFKENIQNIINDFKKENE